MIVLTVSFSRCLIYLAKKRLAIYYTLGLRAIVEQDNQHVFKQVRIENVFKMNQQLIKQHYITFIQHYITFIQHYITFIHQYVTFIQHNTTFIQHYITFIQHYITFIQHYITFLHPHPFQR